MNRYFLLLALCFAGCATHLESTWRSPELKARQLKRFAVFGVAPEASARTAFEEALTDGLRARGLFAEPGYAFVSFEEKPEKQLVIDRLKAVGIDAALVSRIVRSDTKVDSTPVYAGTAYYGGFYGYYSMPMMPMTVGSYTTTTTEYVIETVLYDLEDQKPMWAGRSRTTTTSPAQFARDIGGKVAEELKAGGLAVAAQ